MVRPKISRKGPGLDRTPITQWLGPCFAARLPPNGLLPAFDTRTRGLA